MVVGWLVDWDGGSSPVVMPHDQHQRETMTRAGDHEVDDGVVVTVELRGKRRRTSEQSGERERQEGKWEEKTSVSTGTLSI